MASLTKAQKAAVESMYRGGKSERFNIFYTPKNLITYEKLGEKDLVRKVKDSEQPSAFWFELSEQGSELAKKLFSSNEPDPTPEPVMIEQPIPFADARDMLAEDPQRTDIKLRYAGQVRTVTRIDRNLAGFWDVYAGMRYAFDQVQIDDLFVYVQPNTPDPTPSEPTAQEAQDTASEIVDVCGVQHEVQPNGVLKQLPAEYDPSTAAKVAAHEAKLDSVYGINRAIAIMSQVDDMLQEYQDGVEAWKAQLPKPAIQWRKATDLPQAEIVYWNQRMGYVHPTMRVASPVIARRRDYKRTMAKHTPNMAKGGLKAFIPQSQTPKRVSRRRKQWLREMERNRNRNAAPVLKALGAVPEVNVIDMADQFRNSYPKAGQRIETQKAG